MSHFIMNTKKELKKVVRVSANHQPQSSSLLGTVPGLLCSVVGPLPSQFLYLGIYDPKNSKSRHEDCVIRNGKERKCIDKDGFHCLLHSTCLRVDMLILVECIRNIIGWVGKQMDRQIDGWVLVANLFPHAGNRRWILTSTSRCSLSILYSLNTEQKTVSPFLANVLPTSLCSVGMYFPLSSLTYHRIFKERDQQPRQITAHF